MGFYYGQGTGGLWVKIVDVVSGSSTKNVDITQLSNFHSVDYIITIYNDVNDKIVAGNIKVLKISGSIKTQIYGKMGNGLDIEINPEKFLDEMRLQIINNESFDLTVEIAKLQM